MCPDPALDFRSRSGQNGTRYGDRRGESCADRTDQMSIPGGDHFMSMFNASAEEVRIAGRQLRCQACEHDRFHEREARMNTSVFGFDWSNTKATCMVCERCGFVHWFLPTWSANAAESSELRDEIAALRASLEQLEHDTEELDEALTR